ncbi:MAG TPA: transposase [Polyangiaceae bacterium]
MRTSATRTGSSDTRGAPEDAARAQGGQSPSSNCEGRPHPPKSPIASDIRYADNQWDELGVFLDDERVPLDNNGSERALRRIALPFSPKGREEGAQITRGTSTRRGAIPAVGTHTCA